MSFTSKKSSSNISKKRRIVSPDHPVVMSQFITNAKELEVDGVAHEWKNRHRSHLRTHRKCWRSFWGCHHRPAASKTLPGNYSPHQKQSRRRLSRRSKSQDLSIFNSSPRRMLIKVIECNVRASRSFPFVSKVTGHHNLIEIATRSDARSQSAQETL